MESTLSNLLYASVLSFGSFFMAVFAAALIAERNDRTKKPKT